MTNNITLPRATVQQALDLWDNSTRSPRPFGLCVAMEALRTALEQPEPVAWMVNPHDAFQEWWDSLPEDEYDVSDFKKMRRAWNMAEKAWHQVEPVTDAWAKLLHYPDCWDTAEYPTVHEALDKTLAWYGCSVCKPEHQAPRKPLTDHYIGQVWSVADGEHNASAPVKRRITRAIEAAHGIKEPKS